MAKKGDPKVLRFVVIWLRTFTGWSQTELGAACGSWQADVSRWEQGLEAPPEEKLRRMAAKGGVPWFVMAVLRRVFALALAIIRRFGDTPVGTPGRVRPEPAALAMAPYLLEEELAGVGTVSPEQARREAEETLEAFRRFPVSRRHHLIEVARLDRPRRDALAEQARRAGEEAECQGREEAAEWLALAGFVARASTT